MSVNIRFRKLKNGSKRPYLDIYHQGKRSKEKIDLIIFHGDKLRKEKIKMIEKIKSLRELELLNNQYDFDGKKKNRIDFIKYWEQFLKDYKGKDIRLIRYSLAKFKDMYGKQRLSLEQLNYEICEQFANYLKDPTNGINGETKYNYFQKFKRVINQLIREGYIVRNPAHGISVKRTRILKKNILVESEIQQLVLTDCDNNLVKRSFLFACYTGLGYAEFKKLKWKHIQNERIMITRAKTGEQIINDLHPFCLSLIGDRGSSDELVFNLPSEVTIAKYLKRWVKKAGITKNISFYCGRHTFACLLLINGANLKTVADCMGHKSTVMTLKYLNYVDQLKTEAISSLPNIIYKE